MEQITIAHVQMVTHSRRLINELQINNVQIVMYKALLSFVVTILFVGSSYAQNARYFVVGSEVESATTVKLQIKTFCQEKDVVDVEAQCAAIRAVLFDGIPNTTFHKALLAEGEKTLISRHTSWYRTAFRKFGKTALDVKTFQL